MTPDEFEKEVERSIKETQQTIPVLGDVVPKEEPSIHEHIERVKAYALANACVHDADFYRVYGEGKNRAVFNYSKQWLVAICVIVGYDAGTESFYWQVSSLLINAFTGKAKPLQVLSSNERSQLIASRDIVIRDMSDIAGTDESSIDRFHDRTTFNACCDLSPAEEDQISASSRETSGQTAEEPSQVDGKILPRHDTSPDIEPDRTDSAASPAAA